MQVVVVRKDNMAYVSGSQDLGSSGAALALLTAFDTPFKLLQATLHFTATGTNVISISKDNGLGPNYDAVLYAHTQTGTEVDFVFRPTGECVFTKKTAQDQLLVEADKAGTATVYVDIEVELL